MDSDDSIANRTVVQVPAQLGKLVKRLLHLTPGRQELLITIDEAGNVADWSVRQWGSVEK